MEFLSNLMLNMTWVVKEKEVNIRYRSGSKTEKVLVAEHVTTDFKYMSKKEEGLPIYTGELCAIDTHEYSSMSGTIIQLAWKCPYNLPFQNRYRRSSFLKCLKSRIPKLPVSGKDFPLPMTIAQLLEHDLNDYHVGYIGNGEWKLVAPVTTDAYGFSIFNNDDVVFEFSFQVSDEEWRNIANRYPGEQLSPWMMEQKGDGAWISSYKQTELSTSK